MKKFKSISDLKKGIKGTLLKERLLLFFGGLLGTLASATVVWIILSLLAGVVILPVWLKISLLTISIIASLAIFWKISFSKLFSGNEKSVALKLESKFPELKGRLIAALQFSDNGNNSGYSESLILATINQALAKSSGVDFNQTVPTYSLWHGLRNFGIVSVIAVVMIALFPGLFSHSYNVYSNPTELIAPPLGYKLYNATDNAVAIKYRDLDIGGSIVGEKFPDEATVYFKYAGGIWQKSKIELSKWNQYQTELGDSLKFYTTLKQVRRSLDYYLKAGKITTNVTHVEVVDRPRVTNIKMNLFYPKYTGLQPAVIDENDGNLSAVVGSRVTMQIQTNVLSKSAEMVFDDSSSAPFKIDGQTAEQSFRIDQDKRYYIALVDDQGEYNPDPIEYQITAVPDEYPVIEVKRPGRDINLNDEMMIPLLIGISDDYGFSSLVLKYQIVTERGPGEENIAVLHFSDRIKTEGEVNFNWDVEPLGLMPSYYIKYHFELADNDLISGPKISSSREYIARLPSLDEIIAQTDSEYGENVDRAEQYMNQHKELSERLKNIARKMEQDRGKTDSKMNWQHQKELEEIVEKDANLAEKIKETAENIDKMIDKMQENRLASRELLEKLEEIKKLFQEVATPEMKEARLKMIEALKQMDQKKMQEAMKDFQMSQDDMMKRLERTITLLKKMKIENKVNAMTEKAREMADKQESVNKETEKSDADKLPKLANSEEKLKSELDQLKKEAEELKKMVDEIPFLKTDEAKKFAESVKQCSAGENMKNMSKSLSEKQKEEAKSEGEKSLSKLMSMLDKMQQEQAGICNGGGNEAAKMMRDAIEDINYVSNSQEGLIDQAAGMMGQSEALRDLASEQMLIREMMRSLTARVEDIGNESPFVAAELNNLMRNASNNMDMSIDQFSERRGSQAMNYQKEAMFNLNRGAVRMLDALEQQNNCNKGGSCDKPSQKMQSLCDKQNELNQETQNMCNKPNGMKPSGEEMRRLAGEQGAIRKSLEELQKEFGSSREVLGRLDAITDDMKKVAEQISSGEVGEETTQKQLKIFSRMLDATKTMQRKDFTDQRKAQAGEDLLRSSPPALSGSQLKGGLDIEDRLKKFMNESYPPEYEEHIKAYFKALMEQLDYQITQ